MYEKDYTLVGLILQKIYVSELNFSLGWMCDGGIDYREGDLSYSSGRRIKSTYESDLRIALPIIADELANKYPDSTFATWWNNQRKYLTNANN